MAFGQNKDSESKAQDRPIEKPVSKDAGLSVSGKKPTKKTETKLAKLKCPFNEGDGSIAVLFEGKSVMLSVESGILELEKKYVEDGIMDMLISEGWENLNVVTDPRESTPKNPIIYAVLRHPDASEEEPLNMNCAWATGNTGDGEEKGDGLGGREIARITVIDNIVKLSRKDVIDQLLGEGWELITHKLLSDKVELSDCDEYIQFINEDKK